jgi:hypothetical protein
LVKNRGNCATANHTSAFGDAKFSANVQPPGLKIGPSKRERNGAGVTTTELFMVNQRDVAVIVTVLESELRPVSREERRVTATIRLRNNEECGLDVSLH